MCITEQFICQPSWRWCCSSFHFLHHLLLPSSWDIFSQGGKSSFVPSVRRPGLLSRTHVDTGVLGEKNDVACRWEVSFSNPHPYDDQDSSKAHTGGLLIDCRTKPLIFSTWCCCRERKSKQKLELILWWSLQLIRFVNWLVLWNYFNFSKIKQRICLQSF